MNEFYEFSKILQGPPLRARAVLAKNYVRRKKYKSISGNVFVDSSM